jgi:3-oxoacyl-[acyl-carrier-protein] synthase III
VKLANIYVSGVAGYYPGRQDAGQAVAAGTCPPSIPERTGQLSVAVSEREAGPELAAAAATAALRRAGHDPAHIDLLLHAGIYYQGHEIWAPASYVQRVVLRNDCPAIEVRQVSNGGMACLELASAYLGADPGRRAALLTTGDRFCPPGFDRWRSDPGTVYGDGGTALVLTRRPGVAELRSLVTVSEPELEGMHRGDDPFGPVPFSVRDTVDLEALKRAYLARTGVSASVARVAAAQTEALKRALSDAEVDADDIDWFVLPHFGLRRLTSAYLRGWNLDVERTTWPWARTIGHLGAGDQFAGLAHLLESGSARPGQRLLLAGVGAGFTWSCAVLRVLDAPVGW